ncbi:hypothetical protein IFM89_006154 [Coptis chinensis]|uniref:HECT-type E3 ubiquitin transferase n=1 Tax=Coptis chinensis TaxID=261450 RepID=A0A835GUP1_9MAGN|nr:hypothetical protein IFM89_006154 [Coptis chinensis]
MKLKRRRVLEVPPKIKSFVDGVTSVPLENIQEPLKNFVWDFDKGDFHHWVDLFNHFDSFFEKYIKSRKDLQVEDNFLEADPPFPRDAVLQILRVIRIILDNCTNKHLYNSYEHHLSFLLASTDADVVEASLQTLAAFLKKTTGKCSIRATSLNSKLFAFSQGWGGKEEGLGLIACSIENGCDSVAYELGCTLHFEFYANDLAEEVNTTNQMTHGLQVIHLPRISAHEGSDLELLNKLVTEYKVPPTLRFSLLTRLRFARAFGYLASRQQYICIRLYAFLVLVQASNDAEDLAVFFNNEPEFINELVSLLSYEDMVPEKIRILSTLALVSLCQDRSRQAAVLTAITSGGHRGILPSFMQKTIDSITGDYSKCSVVFAEALLSLVTVLVSSSSGCSVLREAGLIPTLLPLLKDLEPQHLHLVGTAVHVLEAFMDYSNPAAALFRDLGGLDDTIARLKTEVCYIESGSSKQGEDSHSFGKGKQVVDVEAGELDNRQPIYSDGLVAYHRRLLMKALLRAISLGTYAPGSSARLYGSAESLLPHCLCIIFRRAKDFGGGVFSLAATVMSDLIHKDPTCFPVLDAADLPSAFLEAVMGGVICSAEAVACIPQCLDALCLNNKGLQAVKDCNALRSFVRIFTSRTYVRALSGDAPGSLSTGLDELMRHASSLRGPGVDMLMEILFTISKIGHGVEAPSLATESIGCSAPVPMETDAEESILVSTDDGEFSKMETSEQITEASPDGSLANIESFLPECINNAARLLETILQNADTCRIFIDKKGIEAVLQLFTLPLMPLTFSVGQSISVAFRNFSPQHSATLARTLCTFLRERLKATNETLILVSGIHLAELDSGKQMEVIRILSCLEGLLSLSNFVLKGSSSMVSELGSTDADVLKDFGIAYKEIIWQISLASDSKVEEKMEDREVVTKNATLSVISGNGDDANVVPMVRYMNPVSTRNNSQSEWSAEEEILSVFRSVRSGEVANRHGRHGLTRTRGGRTGRQIEAFSIDAESSVNVLDYASVQDTKNKSPDVIIMESLSKVAFAMRSFSVTLVKGFSSPNRRRIDSGSLSSASKSLATALSKIFHDALSFSGHSSSASLEISLSVKCRYLGKVVDDMVAIIFDSRRRTCNTILVNNFYVHGTFKELLTTFEATSQLLWTLPYSVTSSGFDQDKTGEGNKLSPSLWLHDTLQSYCRMLEYFVNSTLLLSPSSSSQAQLLVQPAAAGLSIGLFPVPRDPEVFVRMLQSQVLDVVLPIWNHHMFPTCSPAFITSMVSLVTHIYSEDTADKTKDAPTDEKGTEAPPVDDILASSMKLFQNSDSMAFSLTDLLVTLCNRNKGEDRRKVTSYLVQQLKLCPSDFSQDISALCALSHILALLLSEDGNTREVAAENGIVSAAVDILANFKLKNELGEENAVPKCVTALLLILDNMSQSKPRSASEGVKGSRSGSLADSSEEHQPLSFPSAVTERKCASDINEEDSENGFEKVLGKSTGYLTLEECRRVLAVACEFIKQHVPSLVMQAILKLCARLTKTHAIAMQFLEVGGLTALLSLPRSCFFPGYDSVASAIVRHLLEDPQTLQTAMELEIRQTLTGIRSRHSGRLLARTFLTSMAPVISRDPVIFMRAAAAVCQLEASGGRMNVVLLKDKEKDKSKTSPVEVGVLSTECVRIPENKQHDTPSRCSKAHKKVPANLTQVIDQLLEIVMCYPLGDGQVDCNSFSTPMEVDEPSTKKKGKSKVDELETMGIGGLSERSVGLAKVTFVLKLMSDILLMYVHAVGVILRRDLETCQHRGSIQLDGVGQGGILYHVLNHLLPLSSDKTFEAADEWSEKLSEKASWFLVVLSGRSSEGRKRVINELVRALSSFSNIESNSSKSVLLPNKSLLAFVDLVNSILSKNSSSSNLPGPGCSPDIAKTMIDGGVVQSLTSMLQVLDLDHPDAPKVVNLILKALESLTRAANAGEQARKSDGSNKKKTAAASDRTETQTNSISATEAQEIDHNSTQNEGSNVVQTVQQLQGTSQSEGDQGSNQGRSMEHNQLQVLGRPGPGPGPAGGLIDVAAEPFQGLNVDDIFGVRRPLGGERRHQTGNRALLERSGLGGGGFQHPLLLRPSQLGDPVGSMWSSAGNTSRDLEALPAGSFDVTHFYMFDAPVLPSEHASASLFGDRLVGSAPPPLIDFSVGMDPLHLAGRRGAGDSRWTDDGQPQAGAQAAMIAQAIEEEFISELHSVAPANNPQLQMPSENPGAQEQETRQPDVPQPSDTSEPLLVGDNVNRQQREVQNQDLGTESVHHLESPTTETDVHLPDLSYELVNLESLAREADEGLEMQRSMMSRDPNELNSITNGSAGMEIGGLNGATATQLDIFPECATPTESQFRSCIVTSSELALQDGYADAPSRTDSQSSNYARVDSGLEMTDVGDVNTSSVCVSADVDMDGADAEENQTEHANPVYGGGVDVPSSDQNIVIAQDANQADETSNNNESSNANTIDPTFLEALPEDLRAEVLASQQTQPVQAAAYAPPSAEDIDPEFLAALPPDIQAEVLAQQRAQRVAQSQQAEGQAVEMDNASIIATFPADLREEVLLTSSEAVLSALPSPLLAEAQMLRDRAMSHYQARSLFGSSHRLSGRRNSLGFDRQTVMDRGVGVTIGRRAISSISDGSKVKEIEGTPLLDTGSLKALIRLLRLAQPLGKGLLQRLLLNLCAHSATRAVLLRILLDLIRPEAEGLVRGSATSPPQRLYGCQPNVVYGRAQLLDGTDFSYIGLPPLVSRRILEILTYLATNHSSVANILFYFDPSLISTSPNLTTSEARKEKGKEKLLEEVTSSSPLEISEGDIPVVLFLKLLNQPLFLRSNAHLDQVMGLLQVAVYTGASKVDCQRHSGFGAANVPSLPATEEPGDSQQHASIANVDSCQELDKSVCSEIPAPAIKRTVDMYDVFLKLPEPDLQNLCRLLAREGLSDKVYLLAAGVLKKLASVASPHRKFFISELAGLAHGLSSSAVGELITLKCTHMLGLSAGSMAGAAILRVLQALGALTAPAVDANKGKQNDGEEQTIMWNLNVALEPLWHELSDCICTTETKLGQGSASSSTNVGDHVGGASSQFPPLPPDNANVTAREVKESGGSSTESSTKFGGALQRRPDASVTFARFAEKHRRLLNAFIRQNPGLLEKSLSMVLKAPRLIDFDNKRAYFRSRIRQQHEQHPSAPLRISVRRAYVLEDSYNQLRMRPTQDLKGPDCAVSSDATFQPNPNSVYQTEHLSYFKFVGRVVAKALFDGQLLDVYFTRSFYKHILGAKVTYHDIEAVDPDYYKNLKWMLEVTDYELIPGGRNIPVKEETKHEYVDLVAEHILTNAIRPQINSFLEGFNELVPRELISIFNDKELELLISGLPEIDLDDLKANTEYTGYTAASAVVQGFWEVVKAFSKEDMARFLQFVTGTSKVPLEGFKALQGISGAQRFQIHKAYGAPERLPSAHTCFNQLDLPEYSSKDQLQERLLLAIHEASEGFGFG